MFIRNIIKILWLLNYVLLKIKDVLWINIIITLFLFIISLQYCIILSWRIANVAAIFQNWTEKFLRRLRYFTLFQKSDCYWLPRNLQPTRISSVISTAQSIRFYCNNGSGIWQFSVDLNFEFQYSRFMADDIGVR